MKPAFTWRLTHELLRCIEFNQRIEMYSKTKDAQSGANEPVPLVLPGESEAREKAAEKAANQSKYVAEALGLRLAVE